MLDELRRLSEAGTPGPWAVDPDDSEFVFVPSKVGNRTQWLTPVYSDRPAADAALIVAAVNALPDFLRLYDAARAAVDGAGSGEWPVNLDRLREVLADIEGVERG